MVAYPSRLSFIYTNFIAQHLNGRLGDRVIKRQILMIDSDANICRQMQEYMRGNDIEVHYEQSMESAVAHLLKYEYCLIIMDICQANGDGINLLNTIHEAKRVPILVFSDSLSPGEQISLFEAGADAYLEKSGGIKLCAAQANALIQLYLDAQISKKACHPLIFGSELFISPHHRQVLLEGKPLKLTRKEFDLLYFLASSPRQVFSKEQLYTPVWKDEVSISVDDTIKSHIKTLRKKLGREKKNFIHNIWGVGYKFDILE